jgi:hypothetical protein
MFFLSRNSIICISTAPLPKQYTWTTEDQKKVKILQASVHVAPASTGPRERSDHSKQYLARKIHICIAQKKDQDVQTSASCIRLINWGNHYIICS